MEQDRYQADKKLYLSGMLSLIFGLSLLVFSLYLLPHLIWKLTYDVPMFVNQMYYYLHSKLRLSDYNSQLIIFLIFFLSGFCFTLYSYFASNKIENKIYKTELSPIEETSVEEEKKGFWLRLLNKLAPDFGLLMKLLMIIGLIFLAGYIIEWLMYIEPRARA